MVVSDSSSSSSPAGSTAPTSGSSWTAVALSVAHAIGMGTMIATGALMANVAKGETWDSLLTVHTITGFTTAGLIIAAGITIGTF